MQSEDLPLNEQERQLTELVRTALAGRPGFKPFVLYDPSLRRVIVCIRDCSWCEHWYHGLSIYEDNYPKQGQDPHVGFEIEDPIDLARRFGLTLDRVEISDLLDGISATFDRVPKDQIVIARKILDQLRDTTVSLVE